MSRPIDFAVTFLAVSTFAVTTCLAQTTGAVWDWGLNSSGQLGNGTAIDSPTPVQAVNLSGAVSVSAGSVHTLAVKSDGTVWAWGSNPYGELGLGTTSTCAFGAVCPPDAPAPVQVPNFSNATAVAAGGNFSLALKSDGTVWAWGVNNFGQLGNGSNDDSSVPKQVSTLSGVIAIAASYGHGLALTSDGKVWAWGYNAQGRLGDGTTSNRNTPMVVSNLTGIFVAIAAGQNHSLALRSDGTVWGWGNNQFGQLHTSIPSGQELLPVQAAGVTGVSRIAGGGQQTVALKTDGTISAWGSGLGIQSGGGAGFTSATAIAATVNTITALKSDGAVWTWGTLPFGPATTGAIQIFSGATALGAASNALHGVLIAGTATTPTLVSIAVTPVNTTIASGSTQQYTAIGTYNDGSTKDITSSVTWTSSGPSIAIINAFGIATGVLAGGPVTIRASQGSILSNGASLTVTNALVSISVAPVNASIFIGATLSYTAIGNYSDGTQKNITASVTWSSSDSTTASISAAGIATGIKAGGPVTIRATQGAVVSNNAALLVTTSLVSIAVTPVTATILAGTTQSYAAIGTYSDGSTLNITGAVAWTSSDTTIATINGSGVARGVKAGGPVTIRATQGGIVSNDAFLTITKVLVSMVVTPYAAIVAPGGTQQFTATGTFNDGSTGPVAATWNSFDSNVAGINAAGLATGVRNGRTVTIRATQGGVSAIASLTVATTGSVWAWGANGSGQLGDGSMESRNVPIPVSGLGPALVIATGSGHSLALRPDGTVCTWGNNIAGQLGNGTNTGSTVSIVVPGFSGAVAIGGGNLHSLALKPDGTVWAWGFNARGQLGNGTNAPSNVPVRAGIGGVVAIAGGLNHNLALRSDGTVWAWGANDTGQLGIGTRTDSLAPVQVNLLSNVVAVAAGDFHSSALKSDGTVWAWGQNGEGELGNGLNSESDVPVQVSGLTGVVSIAVGGFHGLALKSDGSVWTWGSNVEGQLGIADYVDRHTAVRVDSLAGAAVLAGGSIHSVVLKSDGTVWTFGSNSVGGQLGHASGVPNSNVPVQVVNLVHVLAISQRYLSFHSLAIVPIPVSIQVTPGVAQIGVGSALRLTAMGTFSDGTTRNITNLVKWELGDPFPVRLGASGLVLAVHPGFVFASCEVAGVSSNLAGITVVAAKSGTAWTWGWGFQGQLGNGVLGSSVVPVYAKGLAGVVGIAGGGDHTLAVKNDGTVWAWGSNLFGQLGNGAFGDSTIPLPVNGLSGVLQVAAGDGHSVALKSDGTVWTWGSNGAGQLCIGSNAAQSNVPVQIGGLNEVVAVGAGNENTILLKSDGTVWTCGTNRYGGLGNGNSAANSLSPVQASGLIGIVGIAAGGIHNLALQSNGIIWGWGSGNFGQLGASAAALNFTPIKVNAVTGAIALAAGGSHSVALKPDGTVWSWGDNDFGQLGDGSTFSAFGVPVQAQNLTGVVAVSGGSLRTLALKSDGTLWAWGDNQTGAIGIGNFNTPVTTPTRVVRLSGAFALGPEPLAAHMVAVAPNTPVGTNVVVQPVTNSGAAPVTLTFSNVTQTGDTSVTASQFGPPPPNGFKLGQPPVYFDITTTAVFSGPIQVCIDFSSFVFNAAKSLKIMHYESGAWVDRTTSVDIANRIVCGTVTSLSPFGLFEPGDTTPPTTRTSLAPPPNAAGWNSSDVTVTLTAVDEPGGSGVKQVTYSAVGAQTTAPTAVNGSVASMTIRQEGATKITFFSTDNAGNVEAAQSITVKLDKTAPKLTCSASPNILWPPNGKLVPVNVSVALTDALSGPVGFQLVSVTSNEPDGGSGDIQGWTTGTPDVAGELRAQRLGQGNGRVYTLTYRGTDQAGNAANCSTAVTVPHDQGNP